MELFNNNSKGAEFSQDAKYRYRLWRIWNEDLPKAMVIGLNPSTANAEKNDNTINVLIKMLSQLGYGGFYMMNCFAYISTDPKLLKHNPMSDEWNNNMLTVTAANCQDVIFAWGDFGIVKETGRDVELSEMFPNAKCFGLNASGSPFHPRAMSYMGKLKVPELFLYSSLLSKHEGKIRTLGFYQPFGSLMMHEKIETRWVKKGKKPPFPIGKYLLYTTNKRCSNTELLNWCGPEIMNNIFATINNDGSKHYDGYGLCTGELFEVRLLTKEDEPKAFVKYIGERDSKVQWALLFKNIKRLSPFKYDHGKQGVGFLPEIYLTKLL